MQIDERPIGDIIPYENNPRQNEQAVDVVAKSIREFGFRQAIVVDEAGVIIAGHTRFKAAQKLGLETVPVHVAAGLSPEQVKAYRLADNATGEKATWDYELLPIELSELEAAEFDMELTGFDAEAIERMLRPAEESTGEDVTGNDPGEDRYQEQYGVIVVCEDEPQQQRVYEELQSNGYACRVVCT